MNLNAYGASRLRFGTALAGHARSDVTPAIASRVTSEQTRASADVVVRRSEDHYERHLAAVYAWTVGGEEAAEARAESELDQLGVPAGAGRRACDLGAGFGAHALPLARRGYQVVAVDNAPSLLAMLRSRAEGLSIETRDADIVTAIESLEGPFAVVLSMGDTLTHLASRAEARRLLEAGAARLAPGGSWLLSFRDYSVREPGERVFVPVRGDDTRVATCILEIEQDRIVVHDLLHRREAGNWTLSTSTYAKLRLAPAWVVETLRAAGCTVDETRTPTGLVRMVARRQK